MTNPTKINPHARHWARRLALQALYQWQLGGHPISELEAQFTADKGMEKADSVYFHELLRGVTVQSAALDEQLQDFLDRPIAEIDPIELTIMRLGAYELGSQLSTPYRVVLNEAISLTKTFGGTDGHKYVNGVLDHLARKLRATEIAAME